MTDGKGGAPGGEQLVPRAVPEVPLTESGGRGRDWTDGAVGDDDRHRYGVLLDHALARGLLDEADYRDRLRELAGATSVEEMQRLVSELPAFMTVGGREPGGGPTGRLTSVGAGGLGASGAAAAGAWSPLASATPARRRGHTNPWAMLVVVVLVVIAAFVLLTIYATHVVHSRQQGAPAPVPAVVALSPPGP